MFLYGIWEALVKHVTRLVGNRHDMNDGMIKRTELLSSFTM
jgi:hypothetical protein